MQTGQPGIKACTYSCIKIKKRKTKRESTLLRVQIPAKAKFAPLQLTIALKLFCYLLIIAKQFKVKDGCLKFVYIGKNPRFTAFLDSNLHTWLVIVTENELGLAFPPRNLPKKFRPDPSTFYLVILVTDRQTDKLMPVIP